MSIKSALISTVNGFITGIVGTVKHRNAELAIINEFYGTTTVETSAAPSILTPTSNTNYPYDLFITKKGGQLVIQGEVGNKTGSYAPSGQVLATFNAGDYLPDDDYIYRATAIHAQTGEIIRLLVMKNPSSGDMELRLTGSMSGTAIGVNKAFDIYNAIIVKTAA